VRWLIPQEHHTWHTGDPEPTLGKPVVTDPYGQLWRWDPNLRYWITEIDRFDPCTGRHTKSIEHSCPNWDTLLQRWGPLTEV
jgi:hypothetical protein